MSRVSPIYPTFARGEVSPLMFGRVDIEPYASCLDKCRNSWVRPFGVVSRIAGTEFLSGTKNNSKARLLKFVFSPTDSYIIECGAGYFRFFNNGGYIVDGNGNPYEISNPFTEEQLASIQYVQLDDVIKIAYKDDTNNANKPLELIRHAANNWELKEVNFSCTPFLNENLTSTTLMASGATGNITVSASSPIFNSKHVGSMWRLGGTTTEDNVERQGFFKITSFTDSTHVNATVMWKLSTTSATKIWSEGAWGDYRGYPSIIGLMDGRLYYGRTPNSPRNIFGSRPYAYEDFTPAVANENAGAINIELATNASGDGSDIKWIIGSNFLLVGTYGSEFVVKGSGDSGITPTDVSARARSNWGVEPIQPITVDSMIHFVQRTGKKIRQFTYDYYLDAYKAVDVSLYSEHLFDSPIIDIAHQKNPDSILWCLREDGKIAGLTLETNQQIQAWCLMEFNGVVESLETIPSYNGLYDEVFLIVKRQINGQTVRHVERIQDIITPEIQSLCWYVRDGLYYSAFEATEGVSLTLSGTSGEVTATSSTAMFNASSVGRRIRAVDEELNIKGEMTITEFVSTTQVRGVTKLNFDQTSYAGENGVFPFKDCPVSVTWKGKVCRSWQMARCSPRELLTAEQSFSRWMLFISSRGSVMCLICGQCRLRAAVKTELQPEKESASMSSLFEFGERLDVASASIMNTCKKSNIVIRKRRSERRSRYSRGSFRILNIIKAGLGMPALQLNNPSRCR